MKRYTDIHAHFVYGMDDGAQTREEMCAMLDAAEEQFFASLTFGPVPTAGLPLILKTLSSEVIEA